MSWSDSDVVEVKNSQQAWSDDDVVASRKPKAPYSTVMGGFAHELKGVANTLGRGVLGATSLLTAPFQLGANVGDMAAEAMGLEPTVGKWTNEQLAKIESYKREAMARQSGNPVGEDWDVAGAFGAIASGGAAYKGIASALPKAVSEQGASVLGRTTGRMLSGGASTALTVPQVSGEDFWKNKGVDVGIGSAFSVALPLAISSGKYIGKRLGEVADLIIPGGAKRIGNRHVNTIISDSNKDEIILALKNAPELIQGSKPMASQALAHLSSASPLQASQNIISQTPSGISGEFGQRIADQMTARQKVLSFAGTEDEIGQLITARTNAVTPLYDAVKVSTASVKSSPVIRDINKIINENKNTDAITTPLRKIRDALVLKTDTGFRLENNPQNLKSLSDNINDMMGSKTAGGKNEFDVLVLSQIKRSLDKQIGIAEPSYAQAQAVFADMSKPINVMQIGSTLKDKLLNPSGTETPGTFLRAWSNEKKLMKEAIGFGRKGTDSYLTPQQMDDVGALVKDLERNVSSKNPLQKTDIRGGVNIARETTISLPNLLSRPAMAVNYVLRVAGKNIEPEVDSYLAKLYLNPKELGKVLSKADPSQRAQFNAIVQSYGTSAATNLEQQRQQMQPQE